MNLPEIDREIADLQAAIEPLQAKLWRLVELRWRLKSRRWIEVNGVTREQVYLLSDCDEYILDRLQFAKWIARQPNQKRFAEWNGKIHFTSDIIAGLCIDSEAYVADLPE